MKKRHKQFNIRINIVFSIIIFIGFVLVANLFRIQIINGDEFRTRADGQYVVATYNAFERGNIFFEDKDGIRLTVAGQKKGYKISINSSKLNNDDKSIIFDNINSIFKIDKKRFFSIVNNKKKYIEIAHKIPVSDGEKIKKELGNKISLHSEKWRVYPLHESASHVIGFLGFDSDNKFCGRYGLEREYEGTLKRDNIYLYTNFFAKAFHGVRNLVDDDIKQEGDIVATIDPQVQLFFEKQINGIQEKWKSQNTGGIIMNPKNGDIYAMASVPTFDNNNFKNDSLSVFKNSLVEDIYEFGSVIKPLVVAIGVDQNLITSDTEYYDNGFVKIGKYTVSNYDKRGRGWVDVQEILNQSLNTGMVFISKKIPKNVFREYFENYGFGKKSGIDLPNDSHGLVSNLKSSRDIEFANMSFGQGVAVSPVSFIKALSALANGGKTVIPHLVNRIEYTNGLSKTIDYDGGIQVISSDTASEVSRMLVNVFDNYRHGNLKLKNHTIAAKTGTAQIPSPNGGYYDDRNLHSFFGYFPAYNPQFIVLMYTVYPRNIKYASQTLIDPFMNISKFLINYYNVPSDR